MLAAIPAPPFSELVLGPLRIHLYGLLIAIGVLAAVAWSRKRYADHGGDPELISNMALWVVPAGLIGARIYHVVTDYQRLYCGPPECRGGLFPDALKIWQGGLGIPGGVLAGFLVGVWFCRRHKVDVRLLMDVIAPTIALAQAIGRWGNYFNQELFGRVTTLPWGLRVDQYDGVNARFDPSLPANTTFHPTFLYESLWNIGVVLALLWLEKHRRLRKGKLFPAYVTLYFTGRMWVENLRIDDAARLGTLRWNFLLSVIMIVVGLVWFFWGGATRGPDEPYGDLNDLKDADAAGAGDADEDEDAASVDDDASVPEQDGVAEPGPEVDRPGSELADAETDEAHSGVGVDPEEGS